MKLIIAILRDSDTDIISQALTTRGYRVTLTASTGGFLRKGQTTLLIGVEEEKVEEALEIIRSECTKPTKSDPRRSTLFVLKVDQFNQF